MIVKQLTICCGCYCSALSVCCQLLTFEVFGVVADVNRFAQTQKFTYVYKYST